MSELSSTYIMKFNDFQEPILFSSIFKASNFPQTIAILSKKCENDFVVK